MRKRILPVSRPAARLVGEEPAELSVIRGAISAGEVCPARTSPRCSTGARCPSLREIACCKAVAGTSETSCDCVAGFLPLSAASRKDLRGPFALRFTSGLLVIFGYTKVSPSGNRGTSAWSVRPQDSDRAAELRDFVAPGPFGVARWRSCHVKSGRSGLGQRSDQNPPQG